MEIDLTELLKTGQKTRIRNNDYFSTEAYVTPFLERMRKYTDCFVCQAVPPSQVSINPDGSENMVYNKVHVEAVLPSNREDISEIIAITYGLDTRKPFARIYKAWKRNDTGCLLLNDSNFILTQDLEPEKTLNYTPIEFLLEKELNWDWIESLFNNSWKADNDQVNYRLGQWVRFAINFFDNSEYGKVKIAANDIITGYKSMFEDIDSKFYMPLATECLNYHMLTAMSSVIYDNKKDPTNLIIKTKLLNSILSIP
jgi:hypothetical protein